MKLSQWIFGEDEQTALEQAKNTGLDILGRLETNENADYAEKAREWLDSWIAQHKENFKDDAKERYGWIRDDGFAILPSALEPDLKKAGFNPNRVYADFKDCGWLSTDQVHTKKLVSIDGNKIRVVYYLKEIDEFQEDIF